MIFQHDSFKATYFYVLLLALISTPVTFTAGIIEWKHKYKGIRIKIFTNKYLMGIALMGIGTVITGWNFICPDIITESGILHFTFLFLNFLIIPLVTYLGYLGGKLVFGGSH